MKTLLFILLIAAQIASVAQSTQQPKKVKKGAPPSPAKQGIDRHYYIAAEDVKWDFAPSKRNLIHNSRLPALWIDRTVWPKQRFVEYTDDSFTVRKPQPEWLGLLGPIIRAEVGDTIYVHFLNRALGTHSIHSHGVRYDKNSEGADYAFRGLGGSVQQGEKFTYKWLVTPESGPAAGEPSSRVWLYHGHVDEPEETNAGLIGPIEITAKGKAKPDGSPNDVDREFIALFMMFDQSPPPPLGTRRSQLQFVLPEFEFSAINGFIFGNLQGLVMNEGERVRWHTMAMGSDTDIHSPHWHGNTVSQNGHSSDVRNLIPAMTDTVDMVAANPGTWMFQCHVADHMDEGMMTYYTVVPKERACPVAFTDGAIGADGLLNYSIANRSRTNVSRVDTHVEIVQGWYQVMSIPVEGTGSGAIEAGGSVPKQVRSNLIGAKDATGYIVVPEKVTFAGGQVWQPRYRGECAQPIFKDKAHAIDMRVLPPDIAHEHDEVED